MTDYKEPEELHLSGGIYLYTNTYLSPALSNDVSICRDSKYDNQDDIDIDITRDEAIKIVELLHRHYGIEINLTKQGNE